MAEHTVASPQAQTSQVSPAGNMSALDGMDMPELLCDRLCLPVQRKLAIGSPDDPTEDEADKMADRVMRMPEPFVQRKCAACENEDEEKISRKTISSEISPFVRTKGNDNGGTVSPAVTNRIADTKGSGSPLSSNTLSFMESRFSADFSGVKIHTGNDAADLSTQLNAQAFTVGSDIYFNEGKYAPESFAGKQLLAHELTHTIQQNGEVNRKIQRSLSSLTQAQRNTLSYWSVRLWDTDNNTNPLSSSLLNDYFRTQPPRSSAPFNGTVNIDPSALTVVTANPVYSLQRGLESMAGYMTGTTLHMPVNTYVNVQLDLTTFGGRSGIFRFIYLSTTTGTGTHATTANEFHIEFVSGAPAASTATTRPAAIVIGAQTFQAVGAWPAEMYDDLVRALTLLPQAVRTQINNQAFRFRSDFSRTATESSEDGFAALTSDVAQTQEINIFRSTTASAINTYGSYSRTVFTVLHEIGHILDFEPIRAAIRGGATSREDSLSGHFRSMRGSGDFEEGLTRPTGFSRAVGHSGSITSYGGTDRKESFGEFFAMYVADRAAFQLLRPDIYTYFNRLYP